MDRKTLRDINLDGKRVLVRVDFNVPINCHGKITDDSRIKATIPTIDYLLDHNTSIVLCSHMGRPQGKYKNCLSMAPVAKHLNSILRQEIKYVDDCVGPEVYNTAINLKRGEILLLENLRFHIEEENNDPNFARELASLAELYVDDAFGTAHRKHASIVGITEYLPAVAGFLLEKEVDSLKKVVDNPPPPFCILLGGAKVSDKVAMLNNVMNKVDTILIGGGVAATFLKAKGIPVGKSKIEDNLDTAISIVKNVFHNNVRLILPDDVLVTTEIKPGAETKVVSIDNIPPDGKIVDIGILTISKYTHELERCRTVFWNGPMGICEIPGFDDGTRTMAGVIAGINANTIIGGGSTAEIVIEMGLSDKMSFVSTGGGASLQFLSGKVLPGIEALLPKE
jgi:phosphoglycerate kinase